MIGALKPPDLYYTNSPQNGAEIEGRKTRSGLGSMKIGSLTRSWEVSDIRWREVPVPELNFPVKQMEYRIDITSFISFALLGEIKRYDTISSWLLSYQEILRHLANARNFKNSDMDKDLVQLIEAEAENLYHVLLEYYQNILNQGDFSFDHFVFYVKEHKDSASPFGPKWSVILDSPSRLREAKAVIDKWIKSYVEWFSKQKFSPDKRILIRAALTYAGVRARPPDYTELVKRDTKATLYCKKWRDRKVGGIPGLSQITYPIFKKGELKKKAELPFHTYIRKLLGVETHPLSQEGLEGYINVAEDEPFTYDLKTAEKGTGLYLGWLGVAVDLSDSRFPPEYASEMYSGIGPTSPVNELYIALMLRVLMDRELAEFNKIYYFSDNFAVDKELPLAPFFDTTTEFCGFNPVRRRFYPASMVTDNPNHRISLHNNHQRQIQRIQYIMRPFMTLTMNDILNRDSCVRFLKWCNNRNIDWSEAESERKDHIKAIIMEDTGLHNDILDAFPDEASFVRDVFYVQENNALRSTDLKVYA